MTGDNVISLGEVRERAEKPDPKFVKHDDFGRPMYCFSCSYKFDGKEWCFHLWAYDMEDAAGRVAGMNKDHVTLDGQLMGEVPL